MSNCDALIKCSVELERQRRCEVADILRGLCIALDRPDGAAIVAEIRGKVFQVLRELPADRAGADAFREMLRLSLQRPRDNVVPFNREGPS